METNFIVQNGAICLQCLLLMPSNSVQWLASLTACAAMSFPFVLACTLLAYSYSTFSAVRLGKQDHSWNSSNSGLVNHFWLPKMVPQTSFGCHIWLLGPLMAREDHFWQQKAVHLTHRTSLCDKSGHEDAQYFSMHIVQHLAITVSYRGQLLSVGL